MTKNCKGKRPADGQERRRGGYRKLAVSAAVVATAPLASALAAPVATAEVRPAISLSHLRVVTKAPLLPLGAHVIGAVSRQKLVTGAVAITPRDDAGLVSYIKEVTTASSPLFHQYLSEHQYVSDFGPTASTITAVKSTLQAEGLRVSNVSPNGLLVTFSSPASRIESAFHTGLATVRMPDGYVGTETTSGVKLPASIASDVTAVIGLDNLAPEDSAGLVRAPAKDTGTFPKATGPKLPAVSGAPAACPDATAAAAAYGGLTDAQIANSYGAFGLYKAGDLGTGDTIALFELEPVSPADVLTFDKCYFGNAGATAMGKRLSIVPVDGGQAAGYGSGESILDVDDLSAMAPGAAIDVYEAPNTSYGSTDEWNAIVAADKAQVVSTSWAECEQSMQVGDPGGQQVENFIFQEAAVQGQSIFGAAGDSGSEECNAAGTDNPALSVLDPSSQPYVVSVGGTTIDDATQPPAERVWNDGANWGGGGGGISETWVEPSWQQDSLVPGVNNPKAIAAAKGVSGGNFCDAPKGEECRELPDVSAQADEYTGAVTTYSALYAEPGDPASGWTTIGGTSSATPIWAAMLTLINDSNACTSKSATAHGVGFVSPLLYAVSSVPSEYAASFNDIKTGNNDVYDMDNGAIFPATAGYDMASGLGTPELTRPNGSDGLAFYLCTLGASASRPVITSITPSFGSTTAPTSVVVSGSGFESGGEAAVESVWVNNAVVSKFTVTSNTSLSLTVPAGDSIKPTGSATDGAGLAEVVVTLGNGKSSSPSPASSFEFVDESISNAALPAVTGVSSYGGSLAGKNTVTVFGSGFGTSAPEVQIGGIRSKVTYVSSYELKAVVPAYTAGKTDCMTDLKAATDMCQVEVVVTTSAGSSATDTILPAYEGAITFDSNGAFGAPTGCGCEVVPAMTEYDYMPAPTISAVSTSQSPSDEASELGGSTVTITGTGFNIVGLAGIYFGSSKQAANLSDSISYVSGTEIQVSAPSLGYTTNQPQMMQLGVWTLAGLTKAGAPARVVYSGVPHVTAVTPAAWADTGGSKVSVTGTGLTSSMEAEVYDAELGPYGLLATVADVDIASGTSASFGSPGSLPGLETVLLCSTTSAAVAAQAGYPGCAVPSAQPPLVVVYPPGNPVVDSASATSGPAAGGTKITIYGQNLGCVTAVYFAGVAAETFSNQEALLDCGSTTAVQVTVPAGKAGEKALVTVTTVESQATGTGKSKSSVRFTYTKA
ncbi:MAG: IPT/TIG domain-containing protein [Acidimicrobiales bacterium]